MLTVRCAFLFLLLISFADSACADDVLLHRETKIHFATADEAKETLQRRDSFVKHLSRFDLQSRMKTDRDVTIDEFLQFVSREVVAWEDDERQRLTAAFDSLRKRFAEFELPFPDTVTMIKTTGKEEGGAAYTRGHAIILPEKVLNRNQMQLERLLAHELFHVLSRANRPLRNKLYGIIGFQPCNEIKTPEKLRDRQLTNPDAPSLEHMIQLTVNEKQTMAVPILYASVEQYDPKKGGSFFQYLTFRMLVIGKREGRWVALEKDGEPVVFDPRKLPAYLEKIGKNTTYIIHPDEILADNFVHLVLKSKDLESPQIVNDMRKVLESR